MPKAQAIVIRTSQEMNFVYLRVLKHLHPCHHHRSDTGEKEQVSNLTPGTYCLTKGISPKVAPRIISTRSTKAKIFLVVSHRGRNRPPCLSSRKHGFHPRVGRNVSSASTMRVSSLVSRMFIQSPCNGTASSDGHAIDKVKLAASFQAGETGEHHDHARLSFLLLTF